MNTVLGLLHRDFITGFKESTIAAAGIVPFAMVVGITMIESGFSGVQAVFMSAIMFAGAAQLAAIELLNAGSGPAIIILAALTVNSRFMMFSASIAPHFAKFPMRVRWLFAYLLADLHYALTMAKQKTGNVSIFWYYLGSALAAYFIWVFATLLGVVVGARLPEGLGLDFAISLVFIFLLLSLIDSLTKVVVATVTGVLAVMMSGLPHDIELLLTSLMGVLFGYTLKWWYLNE